MVTIKQALTNTHGASIRRTIADLKIGEAFKWVKPRCEDGAWCVRVQPSSCLSIRTESPQYPHYPNFWMPIEGRHVGCIFGDLNQQEVHQP